MKSKRHYGHYIIHAIVTLVTVLLFTTCDKNPQEPDKIKAPMLTGAVSDNAGVPLQGVGVHFLYGDHTNILQKKIAGANNTITAINDTGVVEVTIPDSNRLFQNYPNPFFPITTLCYNLAGAGNISLTIFNWPDYDTIRTMSYSPRNAGHFSVQWDGKNNEGTFMTNGFYTLRLTAGDWHDEKTLCIQNPDYGFLKDSKTFFITDSNGDFAIDYKYLPIGQVIPLTTEMGPEIVDTFTIPDSIYIILTKPGYSAQTQKILVDKTRNVNMKFTLTLKP